MPPRSRTARLARRIYLAILTPAAIGGLAAFIGTHTLQNWQARETARTAFTDNQRLEDGKRVDATLENLEKMANVPTARPAPNVLITHRRAAHTAARRSG